MSAATASGRRSYTAEQIGDLRTFRDQTGRATRRYRPYRRGHEHLQAIAVVNLKGGSCKPAANLAQHLALRGFRVLAALGAVGLRPNFQSAFNASPSDVTVATPLGLPRATTRSLGRAHRSFRGERSADRAGPRCPRSVERRSADQNLLRKSGVEGDAGRELSRQSRLVNALVRHSGCSPTAPREVLPDIASEL